MMPAGVAPGGSETGEPASSVRLPPSTEIWLLPASTAITNRPSAEIWIAPCDASPAPVPAPPAMNGDPASWVRLPSACRSNAPIVLVPAVFVVDVHVPDHRGRT